MDKVYFMRQECLGDLKILVAGFILVMFGFGCPSVWQPASLNSLKLRKSPRVTAEKIEVSLPLGRKAILGADLWGPPKDVWPVFPKTVVIFVPGSDTVSRRGRQFGDGIITYAEPVEVTAQWAQALAFGGYWSLAYDKRNCGSAHEDICQNNPLADFYEEGPKALARDVDAACVFAQRELGKNVRIVLWTSEQGSQVVLSSACLRDAAALVFVAPIPYRIDEFWVDGLFQASRMAKEPIVKSALTQKARNLQATFESIKLGQFAPDAKVMGAPLLFWREWIALTKQTASLFSKTSQPTLFVLGENDGFYNEKARTALKKLADQPQKHLVKLLDVDHNLLREGILSQDTQDAVLSALARYLKRD